MMSCSNFYELLQSNGKKHNHPFPCQSPPCVRLFLFFDPPIYKLLTGDLYNWVMYEYHYLLTMVGMTAQGWYNQ